MALNKIKPAFTIVMQGGNAVMAMVGLAGKEVGPNASREERAKAKAEEHRRRELQFIQLTGAVLFVAFEAVSGRPDTKAQAEAPAPVVAAQTIEQAAPVSSVYADAKDEDLPVRSVTPDIAPPAPRPA